MIKTAILQFITEEKYKKRDAEKLRGFFGNRFKDEDLFHNHNPDGKSIFRMPMIQYKVINGTLTITAYNDACHVVADKFLKVDTLLLDNQSISQFETSLSLNNEELFVDDNLYTYQFISYWLPVNQKNYLQFINNKLDLNKVLQNNILSIFKGFEIQADKRIMVKGEYKDTSIKINNIEYFGFLGTFTTNVKMPDYMGIGKFKAIGFGCVRGGE